MEICDTLQYENVRNIFTYVSVYQYNNLRTLFLIKFASHKSSKIRLNLPNRIQLINIGICRASMGFSLKYFFAKYLLDVYLVHLRFR